MPQPWLRARPNAPRSVREEFWKGEESASSDGVVGWSSAPPRPRYWGETGGDRGWVHAGQSHSACEIPSGVKSLLKPPLHPFPEEMLKVPGTPRGVLGGISYPEVRMEIPRAHPSQQPREEDGEKLGIQPSFHTLPRQEPEEDLLYKAKFLLGKTLRDLLLFNFFFPPLGSVVKSCWVQTFCLPSAEFP